MAEGGWVVAAEVVGGEGGLAREEAEKLTRYLSTLASPKEATTGAEADGTTVPDLGLAFVTFTDCRGGIREEQTVRVHKGHVLYTRDGQR